MGWLGKRARGAAAQPLELHPLVRSLADRLEESQPTNDAHGQSAQLGRHVIAVGSGKGGVGKTLVSSSLALRLAELGRRPVVAMDVDLGGANLHTGLGIKRPSFSLNRFILDHAPLKTLSKKAGSAGWSSSVALRTLSASPSSRSEIEHVSSGSWRTFARKR